MNCQASEFAHTQGASLHPAPSSICTAAILDGLMSPSGGDLVVTAVGPVEQYAGAAYNGALKYVLLMRGIVCNGGKPRWQALSQWTSPTPPKGNNSASTCTSSVGQMQSNGFAGQLRSCVSLRFCRPHRGVYSRHQRWAVLPIQNKSSRENSH